jgi:hypothetical protein
MILHPLDGSSLRATYAAVTRAVRESWLLEALALLLAADLAFILVEMAVLITDYGFPGAYRLSLQTEGLGLAEMYGYAHELLVFGILTDAALRLRNAVVWAWAALFLYVFVDDAFQVHEHAGRWLAGLLGLEASGGLRAQDLGELAFYVIVGVIALSALVTVERHTGGGIDSLTLLLVPIMAAYAFFAVGMDVLPGGDYSWAEDGGELACLSFALVATAAWWWQRDRYEA